MIIPLFKMVSALPANAEQLGIFLAKFSNLLFGFFNDITVKVACSPAVRSDHYKSCPLNFADIQHFQH